MAKLALTFDAEYPDHPPGPPDQCGELLDVLAAAGARATFFVQGRWARAFPALARRIADDGHLVGLHCHSHVPYPWLTDEGVAGDLAAGRAAVAETSGVDPAPWFRFPYGRGAGDERLGGLVEAAGFTNIHWSLDPEDWSPSTDVARVVETISASNGDIALLHTWPAVTGSALPELLRRLADQGVELVTVDALSDR